MKRLIISILLLLSLLMFLSCPGDPQAIDLQIDGYVPGASVGFMAGFGTGEEGAVTLGPVDETFTIMKVELLFGPEPGTRAIILNIYRDIGEVNPGELLYSDSHALTASDTELQEIDLSDEKIILEEGGSIRVSIEMTAGGSPSIARDDDGTIDTTLNWIYMGDAWSQSSGSGVTGDWIIRATVETE